MTVAERRTLTSTELRLSDLENRQVEDAELAYTCRRKAKAARQRMANRQPELERLYAKVLGEGWREAA
jgi:hypothetical protein